MWDRFGWLFIALCSMYVFVGIIVADAAFKSGKWYFIGASLIAYAGNLVALRLINKKLDKEGGI